MLGSRERLENGIVFERNGDLRRAIENYEAVTVTSDDPAVVAEALRRQSVVYRLRCEWSLALQAARKSAETAKHAGLSELFSEALNAEAIVYVSRGENESAYPLFEQVLTVATDDRVRGNALQNIGVIAAMRKDFEAARGYFLEARDCFRRAGYGRGEAFVLTNCAAIANDTKDYVAGRSVAEEAVAAAERVEDYGLLALASLNLAEALMGCHEPLRAEELASMAYGYFGLEGNTYRQVGCLRTLGDLSREQGNDANAVRCYEYGLRLARRIDAKVEVDRLERLIAELRDAPTADPGEASPPTPSTSS